MKKTIIAFLAVLFIVIGINDTANAIQGFYEEFDQDKFLKKRHYKKKYKFDLTGPGVGCRLCPTTDETGFNPDAWIPQSAILGFDIYSFDKPEEIVKIKVIREKGKGVTLFKGMLDLYDDHTFLYFNLEDFGLLDEIADGKLDIKIIAPGKRSFINDFMVGKASLRVIAAPIPEPSTLLLLASGLLGLGTYGYRRKKNK